MCLTGLESVCYDESINVERQLDLVGRALDSMFRAWPLLLRDFEQVTSPLCTCFILILSFRVPGVQGRRCLCVHSTMGHRSYLEPLVTTFMQTICLRCWCPRANEGHVRIYIDVSLARWDIPYESVSFIISAAPHNCMRLFRTVKRALLQGAYIIN